MRFGFIKRTKILLRNALITFCFVCLCLVFTMDAWSASFWNWLDPSLCLCVIRCGESNEEFSALKRCSKMAMIKNMEMSIAVATNPKEMAFIDVDDLHGPSLSPSLELYMLHELDLFIFSLSHTNSWAFSWIEVDLFFYLCFFWLRSNRGIFHERK